MRSCEEFELLASLVIDGEASPEERAELARHLETCPGCRAYFEDVQRIHGAFTREDVSVPEGFAVRVMDRVRETKQDRQEEWKKEEKKTVPFPHWRRWAVLAACCAVAVLSAWAIQGTGGVKNMTAAGDSIPSGYADMDTRSTDSSAAAQEPEVLSEGADIAAENTDADEVPPPMPEEYTGIAQSAAKEGAGEGKYQPVTDPQAEPEPALTASSPPEYAGYNRETDAEPTPDVSGEDGGKPPLGSESDPSKEDQAGLDGGTAEEEDAVLPAEEPDAPEEDVEPVEVIGVPEPGILIAYGSAAQDWVENVLGLEWASGGSYPLTAEQYGDLMRTLDETGEPYSVEPGEGYCLMTE